MLILEPTPTDPWATVKHRIERYDGGRFYPCAAVDAARAADAKTIAELRARITYLEDCLTDLEAGEDI